MPGTYSRRRRLSQEDEGPPLAVDRHAERVPVVLAMSSNAVPPVAILLCTPPPWATVAVISGDPLPFVFSLALWIVWRLVARQRRGRD
jgi:hypothetical protein